MGWLSALLHPRHRGEDSRNLQSLSPQEEESEMNGKTRKECYVNRELSWLKFNQRVLEEAERETVPLCERLSFAAIYQSNLDEFFMVRIGSLKDQIPMGEKARDSKTGLLPRQQIEAVLEAVKELTLRRDALYRSLMEQLARAGVRIVDFHTISQADSKRLEAYFVRELLPLLSPVVVGKRQPFPFLRNKEIYAVAVLDRKNGKRRLGIIPCATGVFPRLVTIAPGEYILSEELILHFLPLTFKGYQIHAKSLVRVTRSADIDADAVYDEDLDYREFMAELVKKRKKLEPVRLELSRPLSQETLEELCKTIGLDKKGVLESRTPLDLSFFSQIQDQLRQNPDYFYPRFTPQKSDQFVSGQPFLPQVLQKDKLLAYPFQRMDPFLQILREAASDDTVVSIKISLYRVARHSQVVSALMEAAENGKDVQVLVELKARFDEANNIEWSRQLEAAGCNVIYGLPGYKVHAKLCLITRIVDGQPQYITQIGTGNYNEKTARLYTDLSLMTADPEIGQSASAVFQALAMGETVTEPQVLLAAPNCLQSAIAEKIDREIDYARRGEPAYIGIKVNSLTDKTIMEHLIQASQAGVTIDLIVRGICCLLPGVPGMTENIRVISIVGRFLEHSRIYRFGRGDREELYIASADLMTRNMLRRVEIAAPVRDPELRSSIRKMFDTMLRDNRQARQLLPDGSYVPVQTPGQAVDSQALFCQWAGEQAPGGSQ